ncbi:plastocyanin/azurin family copper-binding protein [Methylophaga sp. OBS3]|uniref:plastocyanin/azurin family copper-binding protein n=1 Tax=Methylophaga sp. OBS3 TaxID=2991934 RepID=UPI00225C1DBC|nr:plastocyanin/azurin family copper-binding protein [Methylophaga sp. OBS3]MCX4189778.1 plastocyanin/azurin family copper-binding protein [Methylophaga sp. OBS3]
MFKQNAILAMGMAGALLTAPMAMAETHTVTAQGMAFQPLVIKIAPGDTVSWENMSTHNVEMIDGLIPEGTDAFVSKMSEDFQHTFEQEGIYVYKCTPHIGAGMGGAVIVGEPTNLDAVKSQDVKGGLKRVADKAIKEAEAM